MKTSSRRGTQHWWVSSSRCASLDGFSFHESRIYNQTQDLSLIRILEKWTWSWLLLQPLLRQLRFPSIRVSSRSIMTCRAPTMDIVSTVPRCGVLISGAHASPLVVTANQTTAPLLVVGPSFPPIMQGQISMLPGAPISLTGAPGMPPALYSAIQSAIEPPALYNAMQSAGAPHCSLLQACSQHSRPPGKLTCGGSAMIWRQES